MTNLRQDIWAGYLDEMMWRSKDGISKHLLRQMEEDMKQEIWDHLGLQDLCHGDSGLDHFKLRCYHRMWLGQLKQMVQKSIYQTFSDIKRETRDSLRSAIKRDIASWVFPHSPPAI